MVNGLKEAVDLSLNGYRIMTATQVNGKYVLVMWNSKKGTKITLFIYPDVYYLKRQGKIIKSVHTKDNGYTSICHVDFDMHNVVVIKSSD